MIPVQAAVMNLLTIGAALGVTVAVFQNGWFASVLGVQQGPIEPWMPVILFAVVFGLSMDYEVFLISRVREQWTRHGDASAAVSDGLALTGRVITAAAAIMVCVFVSFTLGDERVLKEFGFSLAVAVLLDAVVVRCVLLPAVLELLGPITWRLPSWLDTRLPHINIDGTERALPKAEHVYNDAAVAEEIAGTPTLFVCDGDDGGAPIHPCRRVQEALRAADIHYEKVVTGHCNPLPFLRNESRDQLRAATGATKLPALKLPDGTIVTHSRAILAWIDTQTRHPPNAPHAGPASDRFAAETTALPTLVTATRTPDETQPN